MDIAVRMLDLVEEAGAGELSTDAVLRGRIERGRALVALHRGDTGDFLVHTHAAMTSFAEGGDERGVCVMRVNLGYARSLLGEDAEAVDDLRAGLALAERIGLPGVAAAAKHNLGPALARLGRVDEALRIEEEALERSIAGSDQRLECASRTYIAYILALSGDSLAAERVLREALGVIPREQPAYAYALALLSRVLLAGEPSSRPEALSFAERAMGELTPGLGEGEALVRLVFAEALASNGRQQASVEAIKEARDALLARASRISDASYRKSFLERVGEHARTLSLARAWCGE